MIKQYPKTSGTRPRGFVEMKRYAVVIEKTSTGYGAYAPDLPGWRACGLTATLFPSQQPLPNTSKCRRLESHLRPNTTHGVAASRRFPESPFVDRFRLCNKPPSMYSDVDALRLHVSDCAAPLNALKGTRLSYPGYTPRQGEAMWEK